MRSSPPTLVTPPSGAVLTLDEVKAHLRVTTDDEDGLIQMYIDAAVESFDGKNGRLGYGILDQVYNTYLPHFPPLAMVVRDGVPMPCADIKLPMGVVSEVSAITYIDTSGAQQAVDPSVYELISDGLFVATVSLQASQHWPTARLQPNAVTIVFKTGFGADASFVPSPIKNALMLVIADLFRVREAQTPSQMAENRAVDSLLFKYEKRAL